jgi:hypothetical protein
MRNLRLVHSRTSELHSGSSSGLRTVHDTAEPGRRLLRLVPPCGDIASAVPALDPVLHALLERVRIIAPLPHVVRARVLARARATIGGATATR